MGFNSLLNSVLNSCQSTFGETVEVEYASGLIELTSGIFENQHLEIDQGGVIVSTSEPVLDLKVNELTEIPQIDDKVWVRNTSYYVNDVQEDGRGTVRLTLNRE